MSTASSYSNRLKPEEHKNHLKIEDFALGKLLGSGKFGEVYVAQHKRTGFISALKIISKKHIDEKFLTQLTREAKDFILVCLKKDPRDRYTVPELLEHPFLIGLQGSVEDKVSSKAVLRVSRPQDDLDDVVDHVSDYHSPEEETDVQLHHDVESEDNDADYVESDGEWLVVRSSHA
ncbi:spindle assembly checkpoint kinase-like [Nymphaea colorata]|uniref:spindle assembly checkpoint kinase-like n=1 Tax=Nymphaea colorata TaxID=210225 RepID=UPI00129E1B64|nr:spindle assembly checkpoint kinase-like [Nymphaea colorata]